MDKQPTYNPYDWQEIQAYLQGKLNAQQIHLLEKRALQDPFLADALEGLGNVNKHQAVNDVEDLNAKILENKQQAKVVAFKPKSKSKNWGLIGSAAAIFVLAVFGVYRLMQSKPQNAIAISNSNKAIEPNPPTNILMDTQNVKTATAKTSTLKEEKINDRVNDEKLALKDSITIHNQTATSYQSTVTKANGVDKSEIGIVDDNTSKEIELIKQLNNKDVAMQEKAAKPIEKDESRDFRQEVAAVVPNNNRSNMIFNNSNQIKGKAITPKGEPIAFANVQVPNSNYQTITDKFGNFSVPTKSINDTTVPLQINSVGYNATQAVVNNNSSNVVVLTPTNNSLNEVVVTNVGVARKKAMANAASMPKDVSMDTILSPVGGWPAFEQYMNSLGYKNALFDSTFGNTKITKLGDNYNQDIVLEFKADKQGKPTEIQVIQAPSNENAAKAVEAIKKGPKWKSKSKNAKAKVAIKL